MPGIKLKSVSFAYPKTGQVLKNLSFSIKPGEFIGITGRNGSGKSTLLYLLNGLIPHEIPGRLSGEVLINDVPTVKQPVYCLAKSVGLVFQNPDFSLFNLTVQEEISFNNPQAKVASVLKLVGLSGFASRDPQTLSFGQKQKVCLAAILAIEPEYLVFDEPTAMLDYQSSIGLYEILSDLNRKGKTIIIVEHDTDLLLKYAQKVAILDQGKLLSFGPVKTVFKQTRRLKSLGIKIPHR